MISDAEELFDAATELEVLLELFVVFLEGSLVSFKAASLVDTSLLLDGAPSCIIFSRQVSLLASAAEVDSALDDVPDTAAANRLRDAGEGKVLYSKSDTTLTYDGMIVYF